LDDSSATVDVTIYNELFDPNKSMFKEDEFLAVMGKVSEDRFSGGLRITAEKVMDIAGARMHFGRQFSMTLSGSVDAVQIKNVLAPYRAETGLPLTMRYTKEGAACEIRLSDEWRIVPADPLKQILLDRFCVVDVAVEY
jgi:DNA polymerase-3 subunit alpha